MPLHEHPASAHPPPPAAPGRADKAQQPQPQPALPPWRPTSARHKLVLLVATLATVLGLADVLQRPHQQLVAVKAARHAAQCQGGDVASRPAGCPGARMPVLVLPMPASAPR